MVAAAMPNSRLQKVVNKPKDDAMAGLYEPQTSSI